MHFNITKPQSNDYFSLGVMNDNYDEIDDVMYANQQSAAKVMVGATSLADGESGRVPAPTIADKDKYLKGDGTWDTPSGGGGGSSVIPNPTGTPTDTLDTVSIDGTIYEIQGSGGGGSGSGYTETVLNNGTHSSDVYTLSDSISNYDMLEIEWIYNSSYYGTSITSVESFKTNATGILVDNTDNILFVMQYTSETTMTRTQKYGSLEIRQIKGLKFGGGGGGGGISYSTSEQDTGLTWINGETVYQKSFEIQITTASVSNPLIIESDASYIDALIEYSAVAKNASGYIAGTGMSASGWGFAIHRNPSNQLILYGNAIEIVGGTAYVTIKYTKVSS